MHTTTGHLHPLTWTIRESVKIFRDMGFTVARGPELDTQANNFDRLNFAPHHPARDMQDTLWVDTPTGERTDRLMRTHTSNTQIHAMEQLQPPVRLVVPGRVYRNERTDATHLVDFFQFEGFAIDRDITFSDLFGTLEHYAQKFFGPETTVRFRPSYFPFTEPSLEMLANVRGKWLELGGAGMIHPNVIKEMGLDPAHWQGFAFGFGIDRFAAVRYGFTDVRQLYQGDFRILKQFPGVNSVEAQ